MELQFEKKTFPYLRCAAWEVKNEEQTQEVKLGESLPDIGRILGAWGQPLIRSKEWRGSSMSASGGVMAWVLYAPEEGALQCVETWIPFQMQWDFPQTQRDGTMQVSCLLKGIDARSVSARKVMVRAVLSVAGEALEPYQAELFQPVDLPADIQLLRENYPVCLAVEAGERTVTLDEEWTLGAAAGKIEKILHCHLLPEILDQKVMADKVVFRGNARVQMLCLCEDGSFQNGQLDIPFSQYGELEKEYDSNAAAYVIPAVTNMEADIQENGSVRLKAGLAGQYIIYDKPVLQVVTDAYSTERPLQMRCQRLELPAVLEMRAEMLRPEATVDGVQLTNVMMYSGHPTCGNYAQNFHVHLPVTFQYLGRNAEGVMTGGNLRWENEWDIPADGNGTLIARAVPKTADAMGFQGELSVEMLVTIPTDIPMVTALDAGDSLQQNPNRPSLILRPAGKDTLWEIAKAAGSTVEVIREANGLTGEPLEEQMLVIPVR